MRDHLPFALRLYRLASLTVMPALAPRFLRWRLERGKENPERLDERYGQASQPRPAGPLIWLHGASVGEMLAVIPLIERLRAKNFAVLMTSGTVTSAALAEQRLPAGAIHQFVPLDAPQFVERFLDHWRPDLALFVESDLWPNLILNCAERDIPDDPGQRPGVGALVQALAAPAAARSAPCSRRFDLCLAQSNGDARALRTARRAAHQQYRQSQARRAGAAGGCTDLERLTGIVVTRSVIAAASTHPGEEDDIIAAHRQLRAKHPTLLTIIAPRHPERGPGIAEAAKSAGLSVALRSQGELPKSDVDVFVADTLGELGLVYRLAPIVFMGGSLASRGGQNPIEAIRLGAAIVHGPHVWNFAEIYQSLDAARGAQLVADKDALTNCLANWLRQSDSAQGRRRCGRRDDRKTRRCA